MLAFDERLSRRAIEQVAEALVREGLLGRDAMPAEVERCVTALRDRHGKMIEP
jgi:hypothetical protein